MTAKTVLIHLADNEYGSDLMERLAKEAFATYPAADLVEVYEHAGWFLAWSREGHVVGTANDMAAVTPARRAFWERFREVEFIARIRRQAA